MKSLKVCFIGYGSIAKRHISNLYKLCKDKKIGLSIDVLRHSNVINEKVDKNYNLINLVGYGHLNKDDLYDIIFITNPTSEHYKTLKKYKNNAKMFFLEKPACSYEDLKKMSKLNIDPNKVYVACPLRYKKVIQYLKTKVNLEDVISVRAICSSYLPDWRKGTDYTKTYSANKKLGGGVRLDLIHEIDYLRYVFGDPLKVICKYGKYSKLQISTEDLAIYILEYKNKIVELHLDYFGRIPKRELEIFTNKDTIKVDLINNLILFMKENRKIKFREKRDDYQNDELIKFLKIFNRNTENNNNLFKALSTILFTK